MNTLFVCLAITSAMAAEPTSVPVRMTIPGFEVRELPIELTSLNNIEYDEAGRVFAGGYDGRFHLLTDTDGDGLEDHVDTFAPDKSANYPLGIAVKSGVPYFVLTDEVIRFVDTDRDGIPDQRETVAKEFDDKELSKAPYLHRRRVDSSMAIAIGPDDALYVTMGNAGYSNPYWHDGVKAGGKFEGEPPGEAQYSPTKRRGCLLRIAPDGSVTQLASGVRYIMSLQFNAQGDLFGTDQEGATWSPNGNPFDELLNLETGRHYGFPPRHPRWLPQVIDEPSVWDYAPQHQSACGFRFNGPQSHRGRFGPESWSGDAIVTGESRGKLWRTSLVKGAAGYVASNQLIGTTSLLVVDCAISPQGELLICCHTGAPDWGNGPNGQGKLFKIRAIDQVVPQPVLAWPVTETESMIAFDRPLRDHFSAETAKQTIIESGHYVAAADRYEAIRPGYAVVGMQQKQIRTNVAVQSVALADDPRCLRIETAPRTHAFSYAIALPHQIDMAHDLSGLSARWKGMGNAAWEGWLPHPDVVVAKHLTRGSSVHDALWQELSKPGTLTLAAQLDLLKMLIPVTQPRADLGYEPEPETVIVTFRGDSELKLSVDGATVRAIDAKTAEVTFEKPAANQWHRMELQVKTPAHRLDVSYRTSTDARERALATRRFLMPFAKPAPAIIDSRVIPEIAGGNAEAGHALFLGKAACATCHQFRGEGVRVGADLGNLSHRDYDSVLRDILEPNATINPDAIGYSVLLTNGKVLSGTRVLETPEELHLAIQGGKVEKIAKQEIESLKPMQTSLMPEGLGKILSKEELRDLMTYLLK